MPDEIPADGLDLGEFYIENRRHFWGLFAGMNLLLSVFKLLRPILTELPLDWMAALPNIVMVAVALSLAWVGRMGYHAVVVVILVLNVASEIVRRL